MPYIYTSLLQLGVTVNQRLVGRIYEIISVFGKCTFALIDAYGEYFHIRGIKSTRRNITNIRGKSLTYIPYQREKK